MMRNKHPFTLLEIMVCIAILGLMAGAIGWNIKGLLHRSKSQHAKERLRNHLEELQILALTHQADIEVDLIVRGNKVYYKDLTDEPIKYLTGKENLLSDNCEGVSPRKYIIHSDGRIE